MTINIQYVQIATSEAMNEYVTNKLKKLNKKYEWIIKADVYFKNEINSKTKGKICGMYKEFSK